MTAASDPSPLMATYPPQPVTFVRGDGSYLWDGAGRRYLDIPSGHARSSPAVAKNTASVMATG